MRNRKRRPLSWQKKILFSLFTTATVLVIVELGLRAAGVRPLTLEHDPFVGFSQQIPLMESVRDADGREWMRTARSKLVWFNEQAFPRQKESGTKRVFCLGGSTTYGHPYDDATSFSGWMREYLPVVDDSQQWEVINCGGISYASYRVAALMDELVQYEPDLFVVFSGHNEFLERRTYADLFERSSLSLTLHAALSHTRTYAVADQLIHGTRNRPMNELPGEVDEILNHTIGPVDYHRDLKWRRQVLTHYELNLRRMVTIAKRAGCAIVFVTPASNESNCSPFKSEFDVSLEATAKTEVAELIADAESAARANDYAACLESLNQAKSIAPEYAETRYRLGQALMASGSMTEAHVELTAALNEDVCPLRAVDEIVQSIRDVARDLDVPVVDFESLLRKQCKLEFEHECLGEEYFLDHVHPTIDVNCQLARWIIETLQEQGIVGKAVSDESKLTSDLASSRERVLSRIDQRAHGVALRNLAKVLHWSGKFAEAAPRAVDALELLVEDPESRFVLADCLYQLGSDDAALAQYELLFSSGQDWSKAYLPYAELLVGRSDFSKAKTYLLLALLHDPKNAYTHYLLGRTHLELGETSFAIESLSEANRLYPNESRTLELLERARSTARGEASKL